MSVMVQVFAEYPKASKLKQRMISEVGEQAAADLQDTLLEDVLWRLHGSVEVELWSTESADVPRCKSLIENYHLGFRRQCKGDEGIRMENSVASAFRRSRLPLLVSVNCPDVDIDLIDAMTEELESGVDAVMVPAANGGCVALGLGVKSYQLFRGIDWGTKHVADQTLEAMFKTGIECAVFEPVTSVDSLKDVKKLQTLVDDVNDAAFCGWIKQYL